MVCGDVYISEWDDNILEQHTYRCGIVDRAGVINQGIYEVTFNVSNYPTEKVRLRNSYAYSIPLESNADAIVGHDVKETGLRSQSFSWSESSL